MTKVSMELNQCGQREHRLLQTQMPENDRHSPEGRRVSTSHSLTLPPRNWLQL